MTVEMRQTKKGQGLALWRRNSASIEGGAGLGRSGYGQQYVNLR
jgi:hypothetical protein